MADNYLGYQNPVTVDAKLDTESLTVGANTVHRERIEISGANATDIAIVTAANGLQVDVTRSALPSGAATSAKQPALGTAGTASADVITIQGKSGMTAVVVDGSGVTQPISVASLPLPAGASTSARQDTGNTSLTSIDTKTPALGQALAAASVPIVLTAAQLITLTPPAAITGFSTSTKQSDGSQKTQLVDASGNVIGATSNALDINIKSGNLTTLPVTNAGTFAVQSTPTTQADTFMLGGVNIKEINAVTPLMGNGVTGTGSQRVTIASDNTAFAVNATLQTGTNSIGKISDITTSITPGTAAANLGKAEDAAHASGDTGVFALAVRNDNLGTTYTSNDQDYSPIAVDLNGRVQVSQKAQTATLSNVASSATTVTILAANASRIGATIYNDSTQGVYVKFGTTASTTSFTVLLATNTYYEVPAGYTGRIDGIWVSANGNARVTEIT